MADVNGDGSYDILWRRASTGTVKVAISGVQSGMPGAQVRVENVADKFSVWTQQLADYNGDGRTDILWHKPASGEVKLAISDTQGNQQSIQSMDNKPLGWTVVQ